MTGTGDREALCSGVGTFGREVFEATDNWRAGVRDTTARCLTGVTVLAARNSSLFVRSSRREVFVVDLSLLVAGDFALLAFTLNQCLMDAN